MRAPRFGSCLLLLGCSGWLPAQTTDDKPIDDDQLVRSIEARCETLRQDGKLRRLDDLRATPLPAAADLALAPLREDKRGPEDLCALARASAVLVGAYYQCTECNRWHFDAASGFALSADGAVATCWHVFDVDPERRDTYSVVATYDGRVWPIRSVLAANADTDVCIVASEAHGLTPLPLRTGARAGERICCLSNPDHRFAFFSEGLLARWFVSRPTPEPKADAKADAKAEPAKPIAADAPLPPGWPAFEVTLDFALGSSGAAILDLAGNAIGMAQATQTIAVDDGKNPADVQMVVKIAAPAAALRALIRPPK